MKNTFAILLVGMGYFFLSVAQSVELDEHPELQPLVEELVAEKHYTRDQLRDVFASVIIQQSVLDAMTNPAEYKLTWGKYRKIFLGEERIQLGVEFWKEHEATLARAEREYGVPASVIVSIIGVETKFGRITGKHKVLDSLTTLAVGYPRRSAFFARELKEFLILTKENALDPHEILGSYAGAVGYPQFISSSYRNYAVDFSGDGKTDLLNQPVDAIGSVANYFKRNGWRSGEAVTSAPMLQVASPIAELANRKRKAIYVAADLRKLGANIDASIPDSEPLNVVMLDASEIVPDAEEKDYYIVRAGDTACQIAESHSVPCKALFKLNGLNKKGSIYRGQKLKLPLTANNPKPSAPVAVTPSSSKWVVSQPIETSQKTVEKSSNVERYVPMPRYFYTHHNFYAITEYNHSVLYAMAVYDLSVAIAAAKRNANN
ncbi:lytic murein transglycosylase B [Arenicella xantha]|uniref:Lytic murein transglycosylase B n=1 Tax=Arenicella xantha TaxID=644221 RepID=A0A395JK62_9GAMM|nr:lytic murein transglycosylase B [Arenicella xantha]RBP50919.1 lytic murein transglycosylase B [Arenicella xantha]